MGWLSVLLIAAILTALAAFSLRKSARRWWDYAVIAVLAVILGKPLYGLVTGDVSRYLPPQLWSADADGKDQIIIASIAATLLLPLICAALIWLAAKTIWQSARA